MKKESRTPLTNKYFWTPSQDALLIQKVKEYYGRVRPGIVKGSWSKEKDKKLIKLHALYGNNWSKIAQQFQTRTGKQIRDRY